MPIPTKAFGAVDSVAPLQPISIERRDVRSKDVHIKIIYCGICHSDLHQVRNEWAENKFPLIPGHEIVGTVIAVGSEVQQYKKGDIAGVGCMVDSCRSCYTCKANKEQYCSKVVWTYASEGFDGNMTYGGYSSDIVVDEGFVCSIPPNLHEHLSKVAPLLCAGITTYSPMRKHLMDVPGKKIGVVGFGGLGHMAVKFGVAWGNDVTVISTSASKKEEIINKFGAKNFILSTDAEQMKAAARSLDCILDTVSGSKKMGDYLRLLKPEGVLVTVGLPSRESVVDLRTNSLVGAGVGVYGSLIGGMAQTQEMLEFCAEHHIFAETEVIQMDKVDEAFARMLKSDVKYRFVIDVASSTF